MPDIRAGSVALYPPTPPGTWKAGRSFKTLHPRPLRFRVPEPQRQLLVRRGGRVGENARAAGKGPCGRTVNATPSRLAGNRLITSPSSTPSGTVRVL